MTLFDQKLAEAATNAKATADAAEAALEGERRSRRELQEKFRLAILATLRALHGAPPLVMPHFAPRLREAALAQSRFALLELE